MRVFGMGSDEMTAGLRGVAMEMGCTTTDLDSCVAMHPTASDGLHDHGRLFGERVRSRPGRGLRPTGGAAGGNQDCV